MPAMIEVDVATGVTAPERTRVLGGCTCSAINAQRPVRSTGSMTGTRPAADTQVGIVELVVHIDPPAQHKTYLH